MSIFVQVFGVEYLNKIQIFCVEFGADARFWGQFEKNGQIKIFLGSILQISLKTLQNLPIYKFIYSEILSTLSNMDRFLGPILVSRVARSQGFHTDFTSTLNL